MAKRSIAKATGDVGGCGDFVPTDWFKEQHPLYRADVLKDILADVTRLYREAVREMRGTNKNLVDPATEPQ